MEIKVSRCSLKSSARFLVSVYLFLTGTLSSVWGAEPLIKQRIAYGVINNNAAPLWIAQEQGFFRKYGLDADLIFIIGGTATQAMLAGHVPFGLLATTHVSNAVAGGGDLTMVLGFANTLYYSFVAQPTIKSVGELKGKRVAIGTPSGLPGLMTFMVLDQHGLNPKRDNITLLQIGSVPARVAALRAGSVEATSLPPELSQAIARERFTVLFDGAKENIPFQGSGLVLSRRLRKSNPQLVENMAKALIEAVAFIHKPSNKKTVEGMLARNLKLNKIELINEAYESLLKGLPRKPCPTPEGAALVLKLMARYGINPKAAHLQTDDVVDMSLCTRLDETGFIDRAYQGS